jgi:hypothetical protein
MTHTKNKNVKIRMNTGTTITIPKKNIKSMMIPGVWNGRNHSTMNIDITQDPKYKKMMKELI